MWVWGVGCGVWGGRRVEGERWRVEGASDDSEGCGLQATKALEEKASRSSNSSVRFPIPYPPASKPNPNHVNLTRP